MLGWVQCGVGQWLRSRIMPSPSTRNRVERTRTGRIRSSSAAPVERDETGPGHPKYRRSITKGLLLIVAVVTVMAMVTGPAGAMVVPADGDREAEPGAVPVPAGAGTPAATTTVTSNASIQQSGVVEIDDWNDLDAVRNDPDANYSLAADLDESTPGYEAVAGPEANNGSGFEPIGTDSTPFGGTFDGNGHTISGLRVNRSGPSDSGLFGRSNGTIGNVTITDATVEGRTRQGGLVGYLSGGGTVENVAASNVTADGAFVGGLVGYVRDGTIRNATVTAVNVSGRDSVGGLVGYLSDGVVRNGTVDSDIGGTAGNAGGLVGSATGSRIVDSAAVGNVTGGDTAGGLAGSLRSDSVASRVYAVGSVTGADPVGGLVGTVSASSVSVAYSRGPVEGNQFVGGLAGSSIEALGDNSFISVTYSEGAVTGGIRVGGHVGLNTGELSKSYSTGRVTGDGQVGGLVGDDDDVGGRVTGSTRNAYWDINASGQRDSRGGTGLTTAEMTGEAARGNTSLAFQFNWVVPGPDDYPELRDLREQRGPDSEIDDWDDLDAIREDLDGNYTLTADLDETTPGYDEVVPSETTAGVYLQRDGPGFEPLGNGTTPFTGTFDGNGHEISDLFVRRPTDDLVGLFGRNDGTIRNVSLTDLDVIGGRFVGSLAGRNYGTVTEASVDGTVVGTGTFTGGLVGVNFGDISVSSSSGAVVGTGDRAEVFDVPRRLPLASPVSSPTHFSAGGLVGDISDGNVSNASSSADVYGDIDVGGFTGDLGRGATVENASAYGNVSVVVDGNPTYRVGGFYGSAASESTSITDSFAAVNVTAPDDVSPGFGGNRASVMADLYWDTETSTQSVGVPASDPDIDITGLTTAEMTGGDARENMADLDFENTWAVNGSDEYPRLRALGAEPDNSTDTPGLEITDLQVQRYLRNEAGRTVTVEVTNRGVTNRTSDVRYDVPTEPAPVRRETVSTVRVQRNVTFEPLESKTFEFRLPEIEFGPPSNVDFDVTSGRDGREIQIANDGSRPVAAGEVVVEGTNVSGVDGPTPLSAVATLDANETLDPDQSVTLTTTSDTTTLRVVAARAVTTTLDVGNASRSVDLYLLPGITRPVPTIRADRDQPIPVTQPVRFEVGPSVFSFFISRGSQAVGTTPDVEWDLAYPSLADTGNGPGGIAVPEDVEDVTFDGTRVRQAFAEAGRAGVSVAASYPNQPETTFRTKSYRVGTPAQVPPIVTGVDGSEGVYISDPDDELEPDSETRIVETFEAKFLAPDQVQSVTFAPQWVDGGNVTDGDGNDGWTAEFDVSEVGVEDFGPDGELVVVAVDDEEKTVRTVDLQATDPPEWAERIYQFGGSTLESDDGTVGEAITIPPDGFGAQVTPPNGVPVVGGKQIGLSGRVRYGLDTYQREAFAARYGDGSLTVSVPVSAVANVNQSTRIGAAAEYDIPSWQLNGDARFYVIARTLLNRDIELGIPGRIPVVGNNNISASAYVGPGYGFELTLSGIDDDQLTIEEGLGYANISAGAEAVQTVVGQEVFASISGEAEGNTQAAVDNDPNRFQEISLDGVNLGGEIGGAVGARISEPVIGGEYSAGATLFSAGSRNIDRPGPPFAARAGPTGVLSSAVPGTPRPLAAPLALFQRGQRAAYVPTDGRLTDNGRNDTDPAIAGADGDYVVAWSGDAPDRPQSERREIYVRGYTDGTFDDRVRLTDDTAYNVDPSVATAGGTTVVAWERTETDGLDAVPESEVTFQDVRNRSEIAYAVDDGTGWSEPRVLTNDSRYDGAPAVAAFDTGFVVAYERDGDADYTTVADRTAAYARLDRTGEPVANTTLGDGYGPRVAQTTDGSGVRVAREEPRGGESAVVVSRIDENGASTLRTEPVTNLTTFDVAADALAWAADGPSGSDGVTVVDDSKRSVPIGNGTTVRELRLATTGDRRLLQYQGASPTVDEGFMPDSQTTYYQFYRNDNWSSPRTVEQALETDRTIYDHAVTTDDRSFVSVAAAVAFGQPGAVDDIFYVDHEYRPDLTVALADDDRQSVRNATVGASVTLNTTVRNVGDTGTDGSVVVAATDGTGNVTETVDVGPLDAGSRTAATVTTTVPRSGVVELVVDPEDDVTELSEANNETTVVAERPGLSIDEVRQTPTADGLVVNATVVNTGETLVTNASAELTDGDTELGTTVAGPLSPGDEKTVSFEGPGTLLNRSEPGRLTVRATEPASQRRGAREPVPLFRAGPVVPDAGVRGVEVDDERFVVVPILNRGLNGTRAELAVEFGNKTRSRQVCVPPSTADRQTAVRQAFVAAPNLSAGQRVTVALNDSSRTVPASDRGTVTKVGVRERDFATPPLTGGRLPTDTDCDGIYEDFTGDGVVTDEDLGTFFERRTAEALRGQRPRFDANGDSRVDVHDVQAVLSDESEDGASGAGLPSMAGPRALVAPSATAAVAASGLSRPTVGSRQSNDTRPDVEPETDEVTLPPNGTRTVGVVVPDVPVGAFNLTVRTNGGVVSVETLTAVDSEFSERFRDAGGDPGIVAAGHGAGDRIATVTLAGETSGEASLVIDTDDISDDDGNLYERPPDASLRVNVSANATVDDGGDDDGSGDGDDSGGTTGDDDGSGDGDDDGSGGTGGGSDGSDGSGGGGAGTGIGGVDDGDGSGDDDTPTATATPTTADRTATGTGTPRTVTPESTTATEPTATLEPATEPVPAQEEAPATSAPVSTDDAPGFGPVALLVAVLVAVLVGAVALRRRYR